MNEVRLAGDMQIALGHLAAVGVAGILEAAGHRPVRFFWGEAHGSGPVVRSELDEEGIASLVLAHARHACRPESWLNAGITDGPRSGVALFSPRVKAASLDEWPAYLHERHARMPAPGPGWDGLDHRLIGALGEPAWWRQTQGGSPDAGASRWEMKARNRGEEFIEHRLRKLARIVAERDVDGVLAGLVGATIRDEAGSDKEDSRTATGLATPGPVDNAVAWCALWGLHVLPPVRRTESVSWSPAMAPQGRTHPQTTVLPVYTKPVSCARYRSVLTSRRFGTLLSTADAYAALHVDEATRAWLIDQGIRALIVFQIRKVGSSTAPERQILAGEQVDL